MLCWFIPILLFFSFSFGASPDFDECHKGSHSCNLTISSCVNINLGYFCQCLPGFKNISDTDCIDIDECHPEERDAEEYEDEYIPIQYCDSVTTTCINIEGSYRCVCKIGYMKDNPNASECQDIDECKTNVHTCDLTVTRCLNIISSFVCPCKSGYMLSSKGGCIALLFSSVPERTVRFLSVFVLTVPVIPILLSRIMM